MQPSERPFSTVPTPSSLSFLLQSHPDGVDPCITAIGVSLAQRPDGGLDLSWRLEGNIDGLAVPAVGAALPRERLWAHTCCELFVAAEGGEAYREFNFSPSGQWMAFDFAAYRQRVADPQLSGLRLCLSREAQALNLAVDLPAVCLPAGDCRLALTTVVELADGSHRYWALRHPPGRPDFHHRDGFALVLKGPTP